MDGIHTKFNSFYTAHPNHGAIGTPKQEREHINQKFKLEFIDFTMGLQRSTVGVFINRTGEYFLRWIYSVQFLITVWKDILFEFRDSYVAAFLLNGSVKRNSKEIKKMLSNKIKNRNCLIESSSSFRRQIIIGASFFD